MESLYGYLEFISAFPYLYKWSTPSLANQNDLVSEF